MEAEQALKKKVRQLGRLTMKYETSVNLFPAENYLDAFYDYYKIRGRLHRLAPFFFVFDLMFCEYEGFTLCFLSGSNN